MFSSFSPLHSDFYYKYHYSKEDLLVDSDDTPSTFKFPSSRSSNPWLSGACQKSSNYASSIASTSSCSSSSSGVITPPTSPEWNSVKVTEGEEEEDWEELNLEESSKGKGVNYMGEFHHRDLLLPLSPLETSTLPLSPPPAPSFVTSVQPPIRTQHIEAEQPRGRSRWPRILWSSNIDSESLGVLQSYHRRAVGGDLPVLGRGEQLDGKGVKEWSRKMERAGL